MSSFFGSYDYLRTWLVGPLEGSDGDHKKPNNGNESSLTTPTREEIDHAYAKGAFSENDRKTHMGGLWRINLNNLTDVFLRAHPIADEKSRPCLKHVFGAVISHAHERVYCRKNGIDALLVDKVKQYVASVFCEDSDETCNWVSEPVKNLLGVDDHQKPLFVHKDRLKEFLDAFLNKSLTLLKDNILKDRLSDDDQDVLYGVLTMFQGYGIDQFALSGLSKKITGFIPGKSTLYVDQNYTKESNLQLILKPEGYFLNECLVTSINGQIVTKDNSQNLMHSHTTNKLTLTIYSRQERVEKTFYTKVGHIDTLLSSDSYNKLLRFIYHIMIPSLHRYLNTEMRAEIANIQHSQRPIQEDTAMSNALENFFNTVMIGIFGKNWKNPSIFSFLGIRLENQANGLLKVIAHNIDQKKWVKECSPEMIIAQDKNTIVEEFLHRLTQKQITKLDADLKTPSVTEVSKLITKIFFKFILFIPDFAIAYMYSQLKNGVERVWVYADSNDEVPDNSFGIIRMKVSQLAWLIFHHVLYVVLRLIDFMSHCALFKHIIDVIDRARDSFAGLLADLTNTNTSVNSLLSNLRIFNEDDVEGRPIDDKKPASSLPVVLLLLELMTIISKDNKS